MSRKALTVTVSIPQPTWGELASGARRLPSRIWNMLLRWQARAEQRAHLAQMDAYMRRDLGVTHEEIHREVDKPFWRE